MAPHFYRRTVAGSCSFRCLALGRSGPTGRCSTRAQRCSTRTARSGNASRPIASASSPPGQPGPDCRSRPRPTRRSRPIPTPGRDPGCRAFVEAEAPRPRDTRRAAARLGSLTSDRGWPRLRTRTLSRGATKQGLCPQSRSWERSPTEPGSGSPTRDSPAARSRARRLAPAGGPSALLAAHWGTGAP